MGFKDKRVVQRPLSPDLLTQFPSQHPLLSRLYVSRGVKSESELELSLSELLPFQDLKGIGAAINLLQQALLLQQRILIIGDFDADGATSSALAMKALAGFGARNVGYLVPNRFQFGYGLTPEIVEVAKQKQPDLIVTVDNGISSLEGVAAAKSAGIKVLITDHHLAGSQLPDADAIVNPNQPGCGFAGKNTAGVGVIFYVMIALRAQLRTLNWFEQQLLPEPNLADYLDLVALGTVADVVPLDRNNRILVKQGLQRIRGGKSVAGIRALLEVSGREAQTLVASDLGFALGPRLNAAGRLEDMSLGIECLLCDDETLAFAMARELDELNQTRKEIESEMKQQALDSLSEVDIETELVGVCLYNPDWHQGVIGILASRIKDRYHRPTVVFADAGDGEIKGSARSIAGFHIRDALDLLASRYPQLLEKFGGHAMAAGLSIKKTDFQVFAAAFDQVARELLNAEDLAQTVFSDGVLVSEHRSLEIAQLVRDAGPWGQHFPEPQFEGEFNIVQQRLVGERHLKLKLRVDDEQQVLDAIAFFVDLEKWPTLATRLRMVYRMDVNEFRGQRSLQFVVEYMEPC
ncbi:MAG: single-stranded-DNA-specific exonuclease RecJ [Pseudomonadales bacterium]|nr:single-stranded-DNA-specific exonuclease RecJ [Pseudomonadales bacterium]MCP5215603.1 single-stranded-DNA-specific exonuclease RecJ [Pseudomonadales bacterium]